MCIELKIAIIVLFCLGGLGAGVMLANYFNGR